MSGSIPRPLHCPLAVKDKALPILLPLQPPPEPLTYPALPCPSRDHRFTSAYNVTTHIIPAAFPRSSPFIPEPAVPDHDQESKDERRAWVEQCTSELLTLQARHVSDHSDAQPRVLWSVLNRYVRAGTTGGGGLTLLLLYGNGLHKETSESTLRHLFQASDDEDNRYRIDEVWALDAVQQGDSGLVNAERLGALFTWRDHARDILNFILHFLPEKVTSSALPTRLPRIPLQVSEAREKRGLSDRQLVVIGHSFSGCATVLAAQSNPAPFSGLVLVDPVIVPSSFPQTERIRQLIGNALTRRSVWPSRDEAYSLMRKSSFFGSWDPDVLRDYVDYALVEDSGGRVRIKCTNIQEAAVYADSDRRNEAWSALRQIDKRIAMKWILPSYETSIVQSYELAQEAVWRRPENATNAVISTGAHLLIQDSPRQVAQEVHKFLLLLQSNNAFVRSSL